MAEMDGSADLVERYSGERSTYELFSRSLADLLSALVSDVGLETLPIEWRAKEVRSLAEKISRSDKQGKYSQITDVTDLAGARIITYLTADRERVIALIKEHFVVDEVNSVDKDLDLDPDRFGYQSTHLIVSYKDDRLILPEFRRYSGLKAEIQVRTVLQHTWAALDWKLRYKSRNDAPRELRRRLFRISALLEAADDEFSYLNNRLAIIRSDYVTEIAEGNLDIDLNVDSISALLKSDSEASAALRSQFFGILSGTKVKPLDFTDGSVQKVTATAQAYPLTNLGSFLTESRRLLRLQRKEIREVYAKWREPLTGGTSNIADAIRVGLLLGMGPSEAKSEMVTRSFNPTFQAVLLEQIEKASADGVKVEAQDE